MKKTAPMTASTALTALNARLLARIRDQVGAGKADMAENGYEVPTASYFSESQWQAEKDQLFHKMPLIAAHSSDAS